MNTNDKTLAYVQPGGRVRLGDRPTIEMRARELLASAYADTGAPALLVDEVRSGKHDTASDNAALRAIVTALSAQPSPGGQGDDCDLLAELHDVEDYFEDVDPNPIHLATVRAAIEALAARQPVDEVSVKKEDANNYCLILRALGMEEEGDPVAEVQALIEARDRQPVGEPDAYLVQTVKDDEAWEHRWYVPRWGDPNPSALDGTVYEIRGRKHPELGTYRVKPFYAALPAQAVDLGQPDPTLLRFYQVSDFPSLVTALEAHVLQLIDLRKRNVKPWEDTMPPTLLPKWVRENSPVLAKDLMALAEKWQDEAAVTWGESPAHAAKQQCCDELRALIDGKAVGNGTDR